MKVRVKESSVLTESEFEEVRRTARFEPSPAARKLLAESSDPELRALVDPDSEVARRALEAVLRKMICVVPG